MTDVLAVSAAAAALALIASAVKRAEPGAGGMLSAALSVWIAFLTVRGIVWLKNGVAAEIPYGLSGYLPYVFKCAGIGFFSQTAADVCADAGERSAGGRIVTLGKLGILTVCLPLIKSILEAALGYING